ncbi:hypothetical protein D187_001876 [Cystobacter fuscus DSM 2262]|uniref:Uncharacterized protein n=1 Tax=Cystobacter fuscus (strain ATCC 25194 / DSM 2262 / NBRC 100088 / M29) TaxID=1242864 RepID=S9QGE2_CYSF2|nr:hypothetical protein D187_001876 [Cystobacter fuscus DSM 2262]
MAPEGSGPFLRRSRPWLGRGGGLRYNGPRSRGGGRGTRRVLATHAARVGTSC